MKVTIPTVVIDEPALVVLVILVLFALFGGYLSLCRVLCNYFLKDFQDFALKNSMIKKLYTTEVHEQIDED